MLTIDVFVVMFVVVAADTRPSGLSPSALSVDHAVVGI